MIYAQSLRNMFQKIIDKILLFSPITMIVFLAIYVLLLYNIQPFENKYFINYINGYWMYYLALGGLIAVSAYAKKRVFAGTLYIFVLIGQIKMFDELWQQHISQHPTMGPISTFYTFIVFGFFIGLCLEGFSGARKKIKNIKQ